VLDLPDGDASFFVPFSERLSAPSFVLGCSLSVMRILCASSPVLGALWRLTPHGFDSDSLPLIA
jgi:hypothetical protein